LRFPAYGYVGSGTVGSILPFIPRVVFDDAATRAMGEVFDAAWKEARNDEHPASVRDIMAKKIIDAARAGERDVDRLHIAALSALEALKV
jgi:hypothetical protein